MYGCVSGAGCMLVCSGKLRLCYRTVATRPAERRPTAPAAPSACRQVAVVGATSSSTAALQCPSIMKRSTAARVRRVTPLASHGACRRNLCLPLCWHALTGGEGGGGGATAGGGCGGDGDAAAAAAGAKVAAAVEPAKHGLQRASHVALSFLTSSRTQVDKPCPQSSYSLCHPTLQHTSF